MRRTNINYMMRLAKSFADGKSDGISFESDFGYELERRYRDMEREDIEYAMLIYDRIYEDIICKSDGLTEEEYRDMIRDAYYDIKDIAMGGFL